MADLKTELVKRLKTLLDGGHAHATLEDAVKDFPAALRGVVPEKLPYSAWQILEHLRIAQADMLHYSDNADGSYKERKWPDEYWPKSPALPSEDAWDECFRAIDADRKAFEKLLDAADEKTLVQPFPWAKEQSLLKEALQLADHNAYHIGELVVVRRLLGCWKKS